MSNASSQRALVPVLGFVALGLFLLNFGVYLSRAGAPIRLGQTRGCGEQFERERIVFERQAEADHYVLRIHKRRCERAPHGHRAERHGEGNRVVIVQ